MIDGVSKGNNTSSVTKPNVTTKLNEQIPPKTVPNQTGGDKLGNSKQPANEQKNSSNNVKPDNSVNIAASFTKTPQAIWGRSTDDIAKDFKAAGYQVNVRQSTRGSGQAVIIEVKGHPEISQIQYHPGGGRHGGSYYKVSTTTQGTMKVVDPSTYKPTQGEKATIINKTKE